MWCGPGFEAGTSTNLYRQPELVEAQLPPAPLKNVLVAILFMSTLITILFLIVYLSISFVSSMFMYIRGPYDNWNGNFIIPIALALGWPIGIPWYLKQTFNRKYHGKRSRFKEERQKSSTENCKREKGRKERKES